MRRPLAESLTVALAGPSDVGRADVAEADGFDGVDLYLDVSPSDPVASPHLDLRPLPQAEGHRDVSGGDVVAELLAELHCADVRCGGQEYRQSRTRSVSALFGPPPHAVSSSG
jgi:hypothetical protein